RTFSRHARQALSVAWDSPLRAGCRVSSELPHRQSFLCLEKLAAACRRLARHMSAKIARIGTGCLPQLLSLRCAASARLRTRRAGSLFRRLAGDGNLRIGRPADRLHLLADEVEVGLAHGRVDLGPERLELSLGH